ncbi:MULTISPECIES: amidohydrolase family protein [Rhodococcus]|uniref:amidohydrolase family protein n=1 Tax=Rhodococcus globerulus TaxID=33008 RepID=UPI001FD4F420|nr:amidohydrolase family protein [Rhodococcus globerulus]
MTVDADRRIIEDGAVAVFDSKIVAVGTSEDVLRDADASWERIDCRGKMIIPGLVDAHGHAGHSLVKTLGCDSPTFWMNTITPAYFHFTTLDYWYHDGLVSALERVRAGVTTGVSVMGSRPRSDDPEIALAHARAYREVGIRDIVCVGPAGLPYPHPTSVWVDGVRHRRAVRFEEMLAGAEAVAETVEGWADDRIRVLLTPFTIVGSVDPSNPSRPDVATHLTADDRYQARCIREAAARWKVRIHSDAFGGMVRLASKDREHALLGPDVHLQHCTGLSAEEVEILAATGTHVTHAPGGRAPIPHMMAAGVTVAITTDGSSPRRPFDLLQAARSAQSALHIRFDDNYLLPPGKLLEMITIDAATAMGMDDVIGSLEVGKSADIAILDMRKPHLVPNWMPVHRLMFEATGSDIETVIVGGSIVMRDRVVLGVDEEAALDAGDEQARLLVARAGLENHLTDPGWSSNRRDFDSPIEVSAL